jgi:hypothetical protein
MGDLRRANRALTAVDKDIGGMQGHTALCHIETQNLRLRDFPRRETQ